MMSDHAEERAHIWKLPRDFAWELPLVAAWLFVSVYIVLHVFLGVPVGRIVSPYLAFAGLSCAMIVGVSWAARYGAQIKSNLPVVCVVAAYGLVCFPLWAHYAHSLGIGNPKAVIGGAWISGGIWCVTLVLVILRARR
jgi:hypothetical protein